MLYHAVFLSFESARHTLSHTHRFFLFAPFARCLPVLLFTPLATRTAFFCFAPTRALTRHAIFTPHILRSHAKPPKRHAFLRSTLNHQTKCAHHAFFILLFKFRTDFLKFTFKIGVFDYKISRLF